MKLNHYILAAFGLLAVMPFASCSSSGKKNAKESALAGKVYSAGFLNDKSEFYGYIISFNKDGSAQYFDSKTREETAFTYKENSAKNTFQMFSADDKNNQFEGLVEGSSIKYKTSTGQEVELSSGADNFYNFIVEKYKAWNKEGEVYLAGKDDSGTKVISSIEQYDERKNIILKLEKPSYSETTDVTEYTYDDEGRLITKRTNNYGTTNYSYIKRSDGTTKHSFEGPFDQNGYTIYNKDGKVIEYEEDLDMQNNGGFFEYDDKGNVIKESTYSAGGHQSISDDYSYTYKYDSNGNITYKKSIRRNDYDSGFDPESHGTSTNETWFEYDSNNNLLHEKSKDSSNNYEKWYEYDSNNNLIHEKSKENYNTSEEWYEYDSNNNLIHKKSKNNDGDTSEKWYEYDSNNNLIHEKSKRNDYIEEKWYMYALYSDGKIKYKITLNNKQD